MILTVWYFSILIIPNPLSTLTLILITLYCEALCNYNREYSITCYISLLHCPWNHHHLHHIQMIDDVLNNMQAPTNKETVGLDHYSLSQVHHYCPNAEHVSSPLSFQALIFYEIRPQRRMFLKAWGDKGLEKIKMISLSSCVVEILIMKIIVLIIIIDMLELLKMI